MTQTVQPTFVDQQKEIFANLVEQALPEVLTSVPDIFKSTDHLDIVLENIKAFTEPKDVDLILTKIGTFVNPAFVLPAIGSNVPAASSVTRTPAAAVGKKTKTKKKKKKKRGAKKADDSTLAEDPACDQENLELVERAARPRRGNAAPNATAQSVICVPDQQPIDEKENLVVESAKTGRPRRRAAAAMKPPRLAAVTKPMKTTSTRSTRQTRATRARKTTSPLSPSTHKSTGKTPSRASFKRKVLQELVSNTSHPNTPKSPGEELRPKLDHVLPPERGGDLSYFGEATLAADSLSSSQSGTLRTKVLTEDIQPSTEVGERQTRVRKAHPLATAAVDEIDDGALPNMSLMASEKEQNPAFSFAPNVFCDSADEETPVTRKTRSKTAANKAVANDEASSRIVEEKSIQLSASERQRVRLAGNDDEIITISCSESEESEKDVDKDDDLETDDSMVVDLTGEDASAAIIERSASSKRRVSFAEDKNGRKTLAPEADNAEDGNPNEEANSKSPAGRFRVDESGNVTDTALLDLMKIVEPGTSSKPDEKEPSSMTSVALKKKNLLAQSSKRPPIISASRRTVSKTPGVKMPLDMSKQDNGANKQMYDEIANSLFPKSIFSAKVPSQQFDDGQDLFKKSIFSAPVQAESKKKISFASQHDDKQLSEADTTKKRGAQSMDLSMSSPVIVKKPRSVLSSTLQGKSALRERIESVRNRMSNKSAVDAPQTPLAQTQSALAVNTVQMHVHPVKSLDSQAHASSAVQFSKLKAEPELIRIGDDVAGHRETRMSLEHENPSSSKAHKPSRSIGAAPHYANSTNSSLASERKSPWGSGTDAQHLANTREIPVSSADTRTDERRSQASHSRRDTLELSEKSRDDPAEASLPRPPSMGKVLSMGKGQVENTKPDDERVLDGPADVPNSQACAPTTLSNLMTSVKSFLPTTASLFGYTVDEEEDKETEQERAERIAEESRRDAERREAEIIARREAFRLAKQAEAEEKRKRAEAKRKALALAELKREEERQRKEVERMRKLREDIDARKAKKAEEERKRDLRRQRVLEHKRKVQAAEEARRAELAAKEAQERRRMQQSNAIRKGGAGPSSAANMPPPPPKTPGAQRALFGLKKKHSEEFTSYEMSVEKPNVEESSDEEEGSHHGKKRIPDWAKQSNVLKALGTQTEDPDRLFERVHSVNLEEVFASTHTMKKRYRTRHSSGQWTKDRLTAAEEMEYKKKAGYI